MFVLKCHDEDLQFTSSSSVEVKMISSYFPSRLRTTFSFCPFCPSVVFFDGGNASLSFLDIHD